MGFALDHIAVAATNLDAGAEAVETCLGVSLAGGGRHDAMGTHNRLLGLGRTYLEVIAVDPDAPAPDHARWFDLDRFEGPARLTNWIVATDDLDAALADLPKGFGAPIALARGDLRWRMAVPASGVTPFDGIAPALIEWGGDNRPPDRLPDAGCRLLRLTVQHPNVAALKALFSGLTDVDWQTGPPRIAAEISTPDGARALP